MTLRFDETIPLQDRESTKAWALIGERLAQLTVAHVRLTTTKGIAQLTESAEKRAGNALAQLFTLGQDKSLSPAGKRDKGQSIAGAALQEIERAPEAVENLLRAEREWHDQRANWPGGTDADREARLANARTDLHRLIDTAGDMSRVERLQFAARNGSDSMRELIFRERYPERTLWPSLAGSQAEAVMWSRVKGALLKELHPDLNAHRSIEALEALAGAGEQVKTIVLHAVQLDTAQLTAVLSRWPAGE